MLMDLALSKTKFEIKEILLIISITFLITFSLFYWDSMYTIYSYFGLIPVFWIIKKIPLDQLRKFFLKIILLNLFIAFYEYMSQTYLYEAIAERNGEEFKLTYNELSGNVIRAKGIFPGPLTLANFALGATLIFPKDKYIPILSIFICLLANARLGLLCALIIYLSNSAKFSFKLLTTIFICFGLYYYVLDDSGVNRIFDVFNPNSGNNSARLYYMQSSITLYLDYPPQNLLFGNSGALLKKVGNNAESGWLTLLTENGLFGLAIYLIYFFNSLKTKIVNKTSWLNLAILFLVMSIQTFYLSLLGPLWFWLPVLIHTKKNKKIVNTSTSNVY